MKLSVIIPVYNVGEYLEQCLNSVINQTYRDLEIILINASSTDNSGEICKKYANKDNRITYIEEENLGLVASYIKGFKLSTSNYITFVDSDDWLEINMYENMMSKMLTIPDLALVVCDYDRVRKSGAEKISFGLEKDCQNAGECYIALDKFFHRVGGNFVSPVRWNKIFKRELLARVIANLDTNVSFAEDIMVSIPYAKMAKKMLYLDKVLYHYRFVEKSISNRVRLDMQKDIIGVYKVLQKYNFTQEEQVLINETMLEMYIRYLNNIINSSFDLNKKIQEVTKIIQSNEYRFFAENCEKEYYGEEQKEKKQTFIFANKTIEYVKANQQNKKISIIVPVYNSAEFLSESVQSLLNQTYANLEILLINNGSKDNSLEICKAFERADSRIKVCDIQVAGISETRNYGLDIMTGDYVMFMDSDDLLDLQVCEKMVIASKQNNSDIVACRMKEFDGDKVWVKPEKKFEEVFSKKETKYFIAVGDDYVMGSACRMLINSKLVSNLRFDSEIKVKEDLIFTLNLMEKAKKVCYVSDVYYMYRKGFIEEKYMRAECLQSFVKVAKEIEKNFADRKDCKDLVRATAFSHYMIICKTKLKDKKIKSLYDYVSHSDLKKLSCKSNLKSYKKVYKNQLDKNLKKEIFFAKHKLFCMWAKMI